MRKSWCLVVVVWGCALAADRPSLNGTWEMDASHSQVADAKLKGQSWLITQNDDSVEISEILTDTAGKQRKIVIQCNTDGKDCKIKENGQPTQVSMYYNDDRLVMLEQWHGTDFVTKKRMKISDDGKTLTVEVMHIAPPGHKDEVWTFVKQ
jgi:hypothetical protein